MSTVALVTGESRTENIINVLELVKDEINLEERREILIKPNLTAIDNKYANTDVETVAAIIEFLDAYDVNITVGEGSGSAFFSGTTTWDVFRRYGYMELVERYPNVSLMDFDESGGERVRIPVETIPGKDVINVLKPKWDYIISVAIPKTHDYAIVTMGMKNMMGMVAAPDRIKIHGLPSQSGIVSAWRYIPERMRHMITSLFRDRGVYRQNVKQIHRNLCSLFRYVCPDLVVIDGFFGMEGDGPINGKAVKTKIAIASTDPVKADALCAAIMGFDPHEIGYLVYSSQIGLGSLDYQDGFIGDMVQHHYIPHRDYNIQKDWQT
ncbi:MAG: DUF362 domain-containing protein [Euryarchaeota archaeon]|nr:DUF362 domain-containing protein [Euryarchaeota archaeon]